MQSRQQKLFFSARAKVVASFAEFNETERKSYLNAARKLAIDTHNLGLLQGIAFLISRGEKADKRLLDDLATSSGFAAGGHAETAGEAWLNHLIACETLDYLRAKRELLDGVLVAYIRLAQVRVREGDAL